MQIALWKAAYTENPSSKSMESEFRKQHLKSYSEIWFEINIRLLLSWLQINHLKKLLTPKINTQQFGQSKLFLK